MQIKARRRQFVKVLGKGVGTVRFGHGSGRWRNLIVRFYDCRSSSRDLIVGLHDGGSRCRDLIVRLGLLGVRLHGRKHNQRLRANQEA